MERGLLLLKCFTHGKEEIAFPEFCKQLDLNKSTVFRLLTTLEKHGFVALNPEGKYYLGREIVRLSTLLSPQQDVRNKAKKYMEHLGRLSGETVTLSLLDANTLTCIDKIESNNALTISSRLGAALSLFHGATGRSIKAFFTQEQLEHYRKKEEERLECSYTDDEITRGNKIAKEQGYCVSEGEVDAGVVAIAAPFFGAEGQVLGSISVVGPYVRFDQQVAHSHAKHLLDAVTAVSAQFGCVRPVVAR